MVDQLDSEFLVESRLVGWTRVRDDIRHVIDRFDHLADLVSGELVGRCLCREVVSELVPLALRLWLSQFLALDEQSDSHDGRDRFVPVRIVS